MPVENAAAADEANRSFRSFLPRALAGKCPACGEAKLFRRFLKPVDHCPKCGEAWHHHQADDFPPYIVILLLGHILVPTMYEVNAAFDIPYEYQIPIWLTLTAVLALALLQPVKGAVIGYQWAKRLHGFGDEAE